jgi:DNA-binding YbaB/EbfC family protein
MALPSSRNRINHSTFSRSPPDSKLAYTRFDYFSELGQRLNRQLRQAKQEFERKEFENKSSDGMVSVVVTGQREVKALSIDPALAGEKTKQLEALLTAVLNEALKTVREANIQLTQDVTKAFYQEIGFDAGAGRL